MLPCNISLSLAHSLSCYLKKTISCLILFPQTSKFSSPASFPSRSCFISHQTQKRLSKSSHIFLYFISSAHKICSAFPFSAMKERSQCLRLTSSYLCQDLCPFSYSRTSFQQFCSFLHHLFSIFKTDTRG